MCHLVLCLFVARRTFRAGFSLHSETDLNLQSHASYINVQCYKIRCVPYSSIK